MVTPLAVDSATNFLDMAILALAKSANQVTNIKQKIGLTKYAVTNAANKREAPLRKFAATEPMSFSVPSAKFVICFDIFPDRLS